MRVPDILRVTTPVVNKSQAVAPKPSADAVSSFNVQNTSQVNALRQQSQAGNQNAGVLQDKDTPTLLLSLLKDPAVAVTYLQNLSLLEETFQLLPANNTTVTEEIEQIYNNLMLASDEIAPELEVQQNLATTFQGEFFDLLREAAHEQPENIQLQLAVARQLKAANGLMNGRDVLEAVSNNLTFLKNGVIPGSETDGRLDALIRALRDPNAEQNFPRLKNMVLSTLRELEGSLLYSSPLEKNLSIAVYNLSRYSAGRSAFREAAGWLRRMLPPEQAARFSVLAEAFLKQFDGKAAPEQTSRVMQALTELIQKRAQADSESVSEQVKTEKMLHSLLSSPCNFTPLLHYVVPAAQDGARAFAELWINPQSDAKDMPEGVDSGIHVLLVADVESAGRYEAEFFAHGNTLVVSIFCPPGQEANGEAVLRTVPAALSGTAYRPGNLRAETLENARSLMDVFKSLPYKRMGVDVKV